jgi:hypothetical protein
MQFVGVDQAVYHARAGDKICPACARAIAKLLLNEQPLGFSFVVRK